MAELLVLAPTAPDLRGLRDLLGDRLEGRVRGVDVVGKAVGVGLPAAGVGAAKRIFTRSPAAVVLVGTCGVYPTPGGAPAWQPHDVLVASRIDLLALEVDTRRAAFPEPMATRVELHRAMSAGLASVRGRTGTVASPLAATVDDPTAAAVRTHHGCEAEQLEAFAVAHAAHLGEVPCAAVFGVTHVVGSVGAEDFRRFHRGASLAAAEVLVAWLQSGAPGLPHA
ncbi:MAG: hypothetical protein H6724_04135 [Sandaracinus sp.]|nr:hypothetical protein [Sandaracinus sp.]